MEVSARRRMRIHCCLPSGVAIARATRSRQRSANLRRRRQKRESTKMFPAWENVHQLSAPQQQGAT